VKPAHRSPGAPTLLLVPTAEELARLRPLPPGLALCAVCGFGPVAAAARAAELLARLEPRRALLVGIAGTYDENELAIGRAACFAEVALDGVGAGSGERFQGPRELGLPQWTGPPAIVDRLPLATPAGVPRKPLLLTACAAAASSAEARARRARFPGALAEDMEAFAVAFACARARVPLTVVRGASNTAGDRARERWRVDDALAAARTLAVMLLARGAEEER